MVIDECPLDPCPVEKILDVGQNLISTLVLDDLLRQVVQTAAVLVDCEAASLWLAEEDSKVLNLAAATRPQKPGCSSSIPIATSTAGAALTGGEAIIVNDLNAGSPDFARLAEMLEEPARSLLVVPLQIQEHKIGVLEAENKRGGRPFEQTDASILAELATQAALAIGNMRLLENYKQLAEIAQREQKYADALRMASKALSSTLDYDQVIDRIMEQISNVIPLVTCNVMMIEEGDIARVYRGRGYDRVGTNSTLQSTTLNVSSVAGMRRMCETLQPIFIPDVLEDSNWVYSRPEHQWIRSYIGAPIIVKEKVVGFLNVMSATPNQYNAAFAERLQDFAQHAAIAIENASLYRQAQIEIAERIKAEAELVSHRDHLEELVAERTKEIYRLAITDPLTGLYNRRHLMELGIKTVNHARRYQRPLSALMIDIDHFKWINDTYGHATGDDTLRQLAELMRRYFRSADVVGRYGGEEFVVLMPETGLQAAQNLAERMLTNIRALRIPIPGGELSFTASIGVAEYDLDGGPSLDDFIKLADRAMYKAKRTGRDRIVAYHNEGAFPELENP